MTVSITYNNLIELIKSYSKRQDQQMIDALPNIIVQAQIRIANDADLLVLQKYTDSQFLAGEPIYQKPYGWINTESINFIDETGSRIPITLQSYEYCLLLWPNPSKRAKPIYYADMGFNQIYFVPTPDSSYAFQLIYRGLADPIGPTNQTNFLCLFASNLLIKACLFELQLFLENYGEDLATWEADYNKALQGFISNDRARLLDRYAQFNREQS